VDLVPLRPFTEAWVRTAVVDVLADDAVSQVTAVAPGPYDAVLSDMAPKTTGVRATDEARSIRLADRALELARALGRPGLELRRKLFMGGEFESFRARLREAYREVKVVRPEATRSASVEIYLVGWGSARTVLDALRVSRGHASRAASPGPCAGRQPMLPLRRRQPSVDAALHVKPRGGEERATQSDERRVARERVALEDPDAILTRACTLEDPERAGIDRGERGPVWKEAPRGERPRFEATRSWT
jgi:hypothetical protein